MPKQRIWQMGIVHQYDNPAYQSHCWLELDKFDPPVNSLIKSELPGPARWHSASKRWILPLHWDTCVGARKIANKFNAEIRITPQLTEWATNERKRQDAIPDVNSMHLTALPGVQESYPEIWEAVSSRPFQTVGAAFAARNRSCLIADQPGLGKTVQSIAAVIEAGISGPIIVVAPKAAAKLTWPQELAKWVPGDIVTVIGAHLKPQERINTLNALTKRDWSKATQRVWVITSPNYLRIKAEVDQYGNYKRGPDGKKIIRPVSEGLLELQDVLWSAVIVDESHQTLPVPSGNKKKQSAQRLGIGALEVKPDGLRLALSGTPFRGKEVYLWGTLNWLRPDLYRSYWKWVEKHFDCWRDRYGMQIGRMVHAEQMYSEASKVMIRRTKAEVAKDLPTKIYNDIWLDMDGKQEQAYREMERNAAASLEDGQVFANGVLAELTRLKQFAGSYGNMVGSQFKPTLPSNKFDWLVEFLDERDINQELDKRWRTENIEDVPKIVITSQFSQLIDAFHNGLADAGIRSYKFTGGTSDKDREQIKDQWQNNTDDPCRVLLLTTTAGGVSLTLDAASELVVLDETWNPADQEQVEDRIHRLSRIHQVTIWNVRSKNTIEESIAKDNTLRDNNIKDVIDGQRGVEFARKVFKVG